MNETNLSERESLAIITEMISRTRERYMLGDGNILLLWGYLTVGVSALVWILLAVTQSATVNWLWFLIWIIGGIATPRMARRKRAAKGMKSYSDRVSSGIWSAVGYSVIATTAACLAFLLIGGIDSWKAMLMFALIIVPFAEIAQGLVIGEKSLVAGGSTGLAVGIVTACCTAGGVSLYASWYMPMFMLAFASMMIIPGHILNHKARRENERA